MGDIGPAVTVNTGDGFSVTSNEGTEAEVKANFESDEKQPDDEPADPKAEAKDKISEHARELGKKGGEAAAKARAKAEKDDADEDQETPAPKPKAKPAEEPRPKPESDKAAEPAEKHDDEPSRTKARMERLARERGEERQRREALEREVAELKRGRAQPEGNGKPQITDFATAEEYADALADHKVKETLRAKDENDRREAVAASNAERIASFRKRVDTELKTRLDPRLGEAFPAFLLEPGSKIGAENVVAEEFVTSEMAKPIGLYFADHPEELDAILELPDYRSIVRAFAKLEARLEAKPAPKEEPKPSESKAAPPARGLPTSVQADSDEDDGDMDFDRHVRVYNARDRKARAGR